MVKRLRGLAAACAALLTAGPAASAPKIFDALAGCWTVTGVVRGKPIENLARGQWAIDGKYFLLQLVGAPSGKPYAAALFFGQKADGGVVVHWLDIFGADESQYLGRGQATATTVVTDFPYPDGPTRNEISLEPDGRWRMLVTETPAGKPKAVFSDYQFTHATCGAARFPLSVGG